MARETRTANQAPNRSSVTATKLRRYYNYIYREREWYAYESFGFEWEYCNKWLEYADLLLAKTKFLHYVVYDCYKIQDLEERSGFKPRNISRILAVEVDSVYKALLKFEEKFYDEMCWGRL